MTSQMASTLLSVGVFLYLRIRTPVGFMQMKQYVFAAVQDIMEKELKGGQNQWIRVVLDL